MKFRSLLTAIFLMLGIVGLSSCEQRSDDPMEQMQDDARDFKEDVEDKAEDVGDETEDAVDDIAD